MPLLTFAAALIVSLAVTPVMQRVGIRMGLVSIPRSDRWNRGVVPVLGGVGVFAALAVSIALTGLEAVAAHGGLLAGAALMFAIGLWDDIRELSPPVKLIAQIMAALIVVFSGYRTGFFDSEIANILLTVVWLVGITNAVNLLDNMDGLAGGIALIAAGFLSFFFWQNSQDAELLTISIALTGGLLGFLVFNFPPAKTFMGDNGSLLFGFTLAALAIARTPQASNVFAVLGVPILLFALPILDTTFVTITRLMRGQSPTRGGRDHTSHRLVAFGLSERQTVLVLYGVAILSGAAAAIVESLDYTLSLVLIPVLLVSFAILAAYLSRLKVVEAERREGPLMTLLQDLTYRRRLFDIILDFFIVSIAYYIAFWTRSGFTLTDNGIERLLQTLPVVVGSVYVVFFLLGIYQGLWRFIDLRDLVRLSQAVLGAVVLAASIEWLVFSRDAFSLGRVFLFAVFLSLGLTVTRASFRLLDAISPQQSSRSSGKVERVLIYGTGVQADLVLRWLNANPDIGFLVAGLLDSDPFIRGRRIHEMEVLGGAEELAKMVEEKGVVGVIYAPEEGGIDGLSTLKSAASAAGVWVRVVRVELTDM